MIVAKVGVMRIKAKNLKKVTRQNRLKSHPRPENQPRQQQDQPQQQDQLQLPEDQPRQLENHPLQQDQRQQENQPRHLKKITRQKNQPKNQQRFLRNQQIAHLTENRLHQANQNRVLLKLKFTTVVQRTFLELS